MWDCKFTFQTHANVPNIKFWTYICRYLCKLFTNSHIIWPIKINFTLTCIVLPLMDTGHMYLFFTDSHCTYFWFSFYWSSVEWNVKFIVWIELTLLQIISLIYLTFFLCILQYSVFGSIMTIGGVIGGLISGRMANLIGRRGVHFFCHLSISCWYFYYYKFLFLKGIPSNLLLIL